MRLTTWGLAGVVGVALAACGSSKEPAPSTIAAAAGAGSTQELNQDDLLVTARLPRQTEEIEYVSEIGVLAKHLAQAIQAGAPDLQPAAKTVSILTLRPDLDRLGNEDAHSFVMLTFNVSDLKAAQINRLGAYGVLDLATEVKPVLPWQLAIGSWCQQHDRAPNFCMNTKLSLGDGVPWNGPQ